MSIQINSAHDIRVEYRGHFYAEDELRESIWLVNMELRNGLPRRERIEAKQQIAEVYEARFQVDAPLAPPAQWCCR